MRNTHGGWPPSKIRVETQVNENSDYVADAFKKINNSLLVSHGCLFYGTRVVIPANLQPQVLEILYLGRFGMQHI